MSGIQKLDFGKQQSGKYRRETKRTWFAAIPFYLLYMVREATAVFTLLYTLVLIGGLAALAGGKDNFVAWATQVQGNGGMMWLAVVTFVMAMYHTLTWFDATPKVMPLQIGDKKVPAKFIVGGHWLAFFFLLVLVLALAGLK